MGLKEFKVKVAEHKFKVNARNRKEAKKTAEDALKEVRQNNKGESHGN